MYSSITQNLYIFRSINGLNIIKDRWRAHEGNLKNKEKAIGVVIGNSQLIH